MVLKTIHKQHSFLYGELSRLCHKIFISKENSEQYYTSNINGELQRLTNQAIAKGEDMVSSLNALNARLNAIDPADNILKAKIEEVLAASEEFYTNYIASWYNEGERVEQIDCGIVTMQEKAGDISKEERQTLTKTIKERPHSEPEQEIITEYYIQTFDNILQFIRDGKPWQKLFYTYSGYPNTEFVWNISTLELFALLIPGSYKELSERSKKHALILTIIFISEKLYKLKSDYMDGKSPFNNQDFLKLLNYYEFTKHNQGAA